MLVLSDIVSREDSPAGEFNPLVDEIAAGIAHITQETEPQFVKLAGQLQQIFATSISFAQDTRKQMNCLREVLEGAEFDPEQGIAAQVTSALEESFYQTGELDAELNRKCQALIKMQQHGRELSSLGNNLRCCRTSFSVECGRNPEYKAAFGDFLTELRHLAGEVSDFGNSLEEQSRKLHSTLYRQSKETRSNLQYLQQYAQQSQIAADSSGRETGRLIQQATQTMREIEQSSIQLRKQSEDAGYFMQFGDITRQRLEHVVTALATTQGAANKARNPVVLALVSAHLDGISAETEDAVVRLHEALSNMITESARLSAQLTDRQANSSLLQGSRSQVFCEHVRALAALRDQGRQLYGEAMRSGQQANASTAEMAAQLRVFRTLTRRMHLIALNAIIKSENFGSKSATLSVLSSHVQELYQDASKLIERTNLVLETVGAGEVTEQTVETAEEPGLEAALERITGIGTRLAQAIASADAIHAGQTALLAAARSQLEFLSQLARKSRVYSRRLTELNAKIPSAGYSAGVNLDDISGIYTMESERDVHRRVLQSFSSSAGVSESDNVFATRESSGFNDSNIEFF